MSLREFLVKQLIDVIQWTESDDDVLAYRYPMQDIGTQNGGHLTMPTRAKFCAKCGKPQL